VVLAGIVVGVFALITALQHGNRASAASSSTCTVVAGTSPGTEVADVGVGTETTTLAVNASSKLTVNGATCTATSPLSANINSITSISMSMLPIPTSTDIPTKVVLSETGPGGSFRCSLPISGDLSYSVLTDPTQTLSTVPFEVDGAAGANLTAGTKNGVTGVDANGCSAPDVTVTGMGSYDLVAANSPTALTLSAGGWTGANSGPTTIPTALDGTAQGAAGVPDTFVAGDSSETFLTNTPGSTLDFSTAYPTCASTPNPCTLTANSSSAASVATATGLAQYTASITGNAVSTSPTYTYGPNGDFTTLNGLGSGSTTFYPDVSPAAYQVNGNNVGVVGSTAGDYAVTIAGPGGSGAGTNDQVTAGATAETFTVTGSGLTVNGSSGDTTFTVAPPTGTTGGNTFVPGSGADNFYATGTANTVDFTNVLTSGSNAELTINRSGAPQGIGTGGSTVLPNGGAAVGSVPTYKFLNSATSSSASHFTTFRGAATGFTQFLAGPTGGLTFLGQGVANSNGASFLGNASGVVANLSGSTVTTSANIGAGTTLSGFSLPDGQVLVAPPTGTSCPAASCDTIADLTNVTGPSFGYSTFYAGDAANGTSGNIYNFSDAGNNNTFFGGASTDVFGSTGNDNDYVAGSGSATFNESSQQSPNNTIDFSHVPVAFACATLSSPTPVQPCSLTVNVSGQQTAVPNYGAAMLDAQNNKIRTYGFATGGPNFTTFIGALGGFTTFQGGLGGYTYTGQGSGNTLDFSDVSSSVATTLSFDATTTPTQSATLANVPETFSGITTLVGLAAGNTVFTGGSTGGYTFKGNGSGNTAAFICTGAVINLSTTAVTSGTAPVGGGQAYVPGGGIGPCAPHSLSQSYDNLVDISNVNDARQGAGGTVTTGDTFVAGSGSEVFGDVFDALGDTIDFSNVNTGSGAPLTVNVSGAFASGVANDTATVGGAATYTFTTGGNDPLNKDFTTFVGPTRGFATFLAGDPAGHTFAAKGNSNSIDYSAATKGVTVDLHTSTGTVSEGSLPPDTITGLTTVTGSSAGGNKFTAGSGGPYNFTGNGNGNVFTGGSGLDVFSSNGNNNDFIAGSGSATFNDGGSANYLDFTSVGTSLVVNVSGVQVGTTAADTATSSGGSTYNFTTFGNNPTIIIGSAQGTSFFAGTATDTFLGQGLPSDTLSFLHTQSAGPLSINVVGTNCASPTTYGQATVNSIQESFCGIKTFDGLPAGSNTFVGDSTGGYTYTASGGTNTADFTAATSGINANLATGVVTVNTGACPGAGCDMVNGVTSIRGASAGGNTFVAGQGSETFSDAGGVGNAIDFSSLPTGSGTGLTVNVSGVTINGVNNDTATFNGSVYNFQIGGSGFTNLTGASNGNTTFEAGSTPGYTLTGNGPGNSVDFSTVTCGGVNVNLATAPGSVTFLGHCGAGSDTVSGLTAATGSTSGGNKFEAGAAVATYTFTGNGNGNTFVGDPDSSAGSATDVFSSNGTQNTFTAGLGAATFNDSTPGNTIDFSAVSARLTVNVSGGQVGGTANDTASGGNLYTFSSFGAAQTTIKGASGGTTFDAGTSPDTFIGDGPTGSDQLSFAFIPSNGPLSITPLEGCSLATNNLGQATLGSVTEKFCGIQVFAGLQAGNSTFVGDSTSGYTFTATGSNNTADFSAATSGVTVGDLGNVQLASGQDLITGVTSLLGSMAGHNTFVAGPTSETFGDKGTNGADAIDFSKVPTGSSTPLKVNVSGTPGTYTATVGATTYSFTVGGAGFTSFTGSSSGNTVYLAGSTPGYSFTGSQSGNSIDFSAVPAGVYVDLLDAPGTAVGFKNTKCAAPGPTCDSLTGLSTVIGSANGGNTFLAGPSGTYTFTGNGNGNTFIGDADPGSASATDVFSSSGNGNDFVAGAGGATFNDAVAGNTIDFSAVNNPLTVNVSNAQVGGTPSDEATGGGPYVFTSFGSNRTTIIGAKGGTTFYAGVAPDTFVGTGPAANNHLSFASPILSGQLAITPVIACPAPGSTPPLGKALFNSVNEPFCDIAGFAGLPGGNTTFVADGTSGYTFTGTGTNNTADFSSAGSGITADLSSQSPGNVVVASGSDTVTGVTSMLGATAGHNTFVAGTTSETFGDTGTNGGDAINFSHVVTSSSAPLFVNASAAPVNNSVNSDTAGNGSLTDTFTTGGANFTTFIGASSGFTKFSAPADTGGYTFCATGIGSACGSGTVAGDTADFSANSSGITANLSPSVEAGLSTGQISVGTNTPSDRVSGMANLVGSPSSSASAPNTFFGGLTGTGFTSAGFANALSYVGLSALGGVKVDVTAGRASLLCPPAASCSGLPNKVDTFSFSPGSGLSVQGSPGNDDFLVGTAAVALSGGGGNDALDLSALPVSSGTTGATVNLNTGSVTDPAIGGVTFIPGCGSAGDLCVTSVTGSHYDDTFIANAGSLGAAGPALSPLSGNGGNDTLDLSAVPNGSATVTMPPTAGTQGTVTEGPAAITFTGVANVIGTAASGDTFTAGQGTESFTEPNNANPGTLDFSKVGTGTAGVTVSVGQVGGVSSGSTTSAAAANVNDSFSNITTFIGTQGPDTFKQSGAGNYSFQGGAGSNVLDLSNAPSDENVTINPPAPASACTPGVNANDGTAASQGTATHDTFTCMVDVIGAGTPVFQVYPNQPQAMLNGGGNGHVELMQSTAGATVNLGNGTVTSKDYNFKFTGMSTIDGTPFNDLFVPGTGNVTLNGGGGSDGVSFGGTPSGIPPAPAAVVANLSTSSYTVPTGFFAAGTSVPPTTAIGGYGGTVTMKGISNLIGTKQFNDVLVGGATPGSLISGGSGNDRFVLDGGDTFVSGGTGTGTSLDLSTLPGYTTLDLGKSYPQNTGAGTVTVAPNSIHTLMASPGGSKLSGGSGNVTLMGGPGNDTLAGGTGTQTLIGGGGTDTLTAGVGNQTLEGGAQPVTFVPGGCFPNTPCTDTLTSAGSGNTLDYSAAPPTANCTNPGGPPCGVEVNLSSQLFPVPQNEPMGGTVLNSLSATGGYGATADLSKANITTVNGSPQADIVVTGTGGNTINGGGGDDLLVVSGGNNQLTAGANTNTRFLFEGAGNNVINGGGNATVDFSASTVAGVTVNLQTGPAGAPTQNGTASGGFGGFQSLSGVLNAIGTNFNDVLVAGSRGGTMTGLNGNNDRLQSGPSGGDTLISGGSASDEFCAEASCAVGGTSAGGGNTMTGGFGNDTFYARNGAVDTIDGGGGFNSAQVDANDIIVNNSIQNFIP
jgi:hypothetical protein